jgi:glyoxylase I family protein
MEKVTGIGGIFFRAKDPKALRHWHQQQLGVTVTRDNYEQLPWQQDAGPQPLSSHSPKTRHTLALQDKFG